MRSRTLSLKIRDSVFGPNARVREVGVKKAESDRPLYRVYLFLEGPDLPFVESVTYRLHPTFQVRNRTVRRSPSNPGCELKIWTWGVFEIEVRVKDRSGVIHRFRHDLTYDQELSGSAYEIRKM